MPKPVDKYAVLPEKCIELMLLSPRILFLFISDKLIMDVCWMMSEDGTQELEHFTIDNSPLFSNSVTSIAINHENGEVFFGTEKGIVSYRGTATGAQEVFTDVYAYPNPVRQGYNGVIAIKGLVADADVKITDLTGSLIYQTTSLGGQAIWNGMNFRGDKAQTGVYLVFATNEDGATKMVTKILFIN